MNSRNLLAALALLSITILHPATAGAQGTAFTYQGQLNGGGSPANGSFDFQFTLYATNVTGNAVAGPITNSTIAVSNGLFTTTVDFGVGAFTGQPLWLDIGVSPAGSNTFSELTPRQFMASTPYAVQAANASSVPATNINGTIAATQLASSVVTNGAANVNISGNFSGNGANLTGVNLITANSHGIITWVTNSGNFMATEAIPVGEYPSCIAAADFNGDGKMDLVSVASAYGEIEVLLNNGNGTFTPGATLQVYPDYPSFVTTADVNGDGHVDIISGNYNNHSVTVFTNDGSGNFALAMTLLLSGAPTCVAAADVNGDGYVDLICANGQTSLTVFTNDGSGGFTLAATPSLGQYNFAEFIATADINGDGHVDIVASLGSAALMVLTNNGSGGFAVASQPTTGRQSYFFTAADVNGDGHVDLVSANMYDDSLTVLTNNGSGVFATAQTLMTGPVPGWVSAADVNGDGHVDLIVANFETNTLTVFTNNGSGSFAMAETLTVGVNPNCIAALDVNGDGFVDLVAPNNDVSSSLTVLTNIWGITASAITASTIGNSSASMVGNGSGLSWTTNAYTPTMGDGTHNFITSTAKGAYTQIGNITFVEIQLIWTSKGSTTPGSPLTISLPFPSTSSPRTDYTIGFVNGITTPSQLLANSNLGSPYINLWSVVSGSSPTPLLVSSCATTGEIQISGFFRR